MKYGLSEKYLKEMISIISTYPQIEKVILFGSRAIGTFKDTSDVDIAVQGKQVDIFLTARLKSHIEDETVIPYFFDVIDYSTIDSADLKKHIDECGMVIYSKKNATQSAFPFIFLSAFIVCIDQWTKSFVLKNIAYNHILPVLPFLNITMRINSGAAFSFLGNAAGWQVYFLSIVSIIISVILIICLCRISRKNGLLALPLSLILGGAVGNLIDRFRFSYVIDFLDVHIRTWHFATFNFADAAVSVGAIWLALTLFSTKSEKHRV